MQRLLRRSGRVDEVADALLVLLGTSAALADAVSSDDPVNDTPIYARQKVLSGHAGMLSQLAALVGPVREEDALDEFIKSLSRPATYAESEAFHEASAEYWAEHGIGMGPGRLG